MTPTPSADARLAELGITLPDVGAAAGTFVPFVRTGRLVFISGQIPMTPAGPVVGRVGDAISDAEAHAAARQAGLALLAVARLALGSLDRVARVVKLTGYVNAAPGFAAQPAVINGCSDLMVQVFGDRGCHARAAVGVASLPFNVPIEVEAVLEAGDDA